MSTAFFAVCQSWRVQRAVTLAIAFSTVAACGSYDNDYDSNPTAPLPPSTSFTASGDLTAKLVEFRAALGEPNNLSTAGQQPGGRREVNWEGVTATITNTNLFPSDFFNVNVTRGLITTTPGSAQRVSDNDFGDINAQYDVEFEQFSGTKTFMAVGSNIIDVAFRVAGSNQPAAVKGFGVVFSDVDVAGSAKIEMFDATGRLIGQALAPVRSDSLGRSMVGMTFQSAIVVRVRITSGQGALGGAVQDLSTAGGTLDLVVMDDFFYSEPVVF